MNKKIETKISDDISMALYFLNQGECIGMPTETVYGLAANACNDHAVQKIYQAKGRPSFNPLIIHVTDLMMAMEWGHFNDLALTLAKAFWQADTFAELFKPLTLVVPLKNPNLSSHVTAGLNTVGIRVPQHALAKRLINMAKVPLAAPSANRSNYISPTTAKAVYDDLHDRIPFILDGGPCHMGLESTIIDATTDVPTILRYGSTTLDDVRSVAPNVHVYKELYDNAPPTIEMPNVKAPGMLKKHYSPSIPVRLNVTEPLASEVFLAFGPGYEATQTLNLSNKGSLNEAAINLYVMLRELDRHTNHAIAIAPIPNTGIGAAINDRLRRAAG